MLALVEWTQENRQTGISLYEYLDEIEQGGYAVVTADSSGQVSPAEVEAMTDALTIAPQTSEQRVPLDPIAVPISVSCTLAYSITRTPHTRDRWDSGNMLVKEGNPDRGRGRYWGDRQGPAMGGQLDLWEKNSSAMFERGEDSNSARVTLTNICVDLLGNAVNGPAAELRADGVFNARVTSETNVSGIWSKGSFADAEVWAHFMEADLAEGREPQAHFSKQLHVGRTNRSDWSRDALHTVIELVATGALIYYGGGEGQGDLKETLAALAETLSAEDVADLFTATYKIREGQGNGSSEDVLRARNTIYSELEANVPKILEMNASFGHYVRAYGPNSDAYTKVASDFSLVGVITPEHGKQLGFYTGGAAWDYMRSPRDMRDVANHIQGWFDGVVFPVGDPSAQAASAELRSQLSSLVSMNMSGTFEF